MTNGEGRHLMKSPSFILSEASQEVGLRGSK